VGKLVNKLSHAFLHAFFPCQRSAGREEEKTERAGMGFGPVGAGARRALWRTVEDTVAATVLICCSRSRLSVSDPMVEVYDKARRYMDLLRP